MADWKSGICECCCDLTCCFGMVCPCVVYTWNARAMQTKGVSSMLDQFLGPSVDAPLVGGIFYGLSEITGFGTGISLCLHADLRHALRKHQNIPACCCPCCCDGFCEDIFCVTSCSCCAFTQEKKELDSMQKQEDNTQLIPSGQINSMTNQTPAQLLRVDSMLKPSQL